MHGDPNCSAYKTTPRGIKLHRRSTIESRGLPQNTPRERVRGQTETAPIAADRTRVAQFVDFHPELTRVGA